MAPLISTIPWLVAVLLMGGWGVSAWRHRRARRKLEHTALTLARISQAVESASDAIGIGDFEGNSVYHNRAHIQLFGYTVEELNAVPEVGVLFADPKTAAEIHTSIRGGNSWHGETEVRTKDGRSVPAFVRADIIRDASGAPVGIFGVFTDITERRAAEKALAEERERAARAQRLESLGMLAGGVAHDFGNLLTIILGNTAILRMKSAGLPAEADKRTAAIESAAWRAQELSKNLLSFARGSAPQLRTLVMGELVAEAAKGAVLHSGVTLNLDLAADLLPVKADPVQMDQVISNLCVNAVQAMGDAPGRVLEVTASNQQGWGGAASGTPFDGPVVRVTIRDNGPGIPAEVLPRIWEPFFTTKEKGTGLGLATVYAVIKKHGGSISVESEAGRGTVFTIMLPAGAAMGSAAKTNRT